MLTVYKYPIPLMDIFHLDLPTNAQILHFGSQNDQIYIWAKIDTDSELETRSFRFAGTGHDLTNLIHNRRNHVISNNLLYIGTVKIHNETLVFHLFEFK